MKKTALILMVAFAYDFSPAQNKAEADKLVDEGIAYHDKGDYEGAISKYDKALELDKDNVLAMGEKAFSLLSLQKYDEAISHCQKAIAAHPGDKALKAVYVTYGNATDGLKKTDRAIEIYNEGIKLFPDFYQLYFNKGITLSSVSKFDEAMLCFQRAVILNPRHASSHNAIAHLSDMENKRIPSLLAYCRFLAIEPVSKRGAENLASVQAIVKENVEQTGKKSVTVNVSSETLEESKGSGAPKENNFATTDLILSMDAALDFDKKNQKKTEVEQFQRKFETVCASLGETRKDNFGFYWDYYAPYFIEMKERNLVETFAYVAFASSDSPDVAKWLKTHKSETNAFFEWSKSFEWKSN